MNRDRDIAKQKQKLITMGKAKGYVTYDEVNDAMPEEIVSSDQIDDWLSTLGDEGIEVVDAGQGVPGAAVKVPAGRGGGAGGGGGGGGGGGRGARGKKTGGGPATKAPKKKKKKKEKRPAGGASK